LEENLGARNPSMLVLCLVMPVPLPTACSVSNSA